jgi:tRNA 2-thiouridine synthesizing protein A
MLLDLRGLNCPLPVKRTRKMLCLLAQRDRLTVECTDPLADIDIPHETGDTLECREAANGLFFICHIKRGKAWSNFFTGGPQMRRDLGAVSLLTSAFAPVKLRQTIKGISIAAIIYYRLSILHPIFEGLHRKIDAFDPVAAMALSVPFVLALILWMFRRRSKPDLEVR